MAESDQLLLGLQEYRSSLDKHLNSLGEDLQQLENRGLALNAVYEGEAAEQFRAAWGKTAQWFPEYLHQMQLLVARLDERIEALSEANFPSGGLL